MLQPIDGSFAAASQEVQVLVVVGFQVLQIVLQYQGKSQRYRGKTTQLTGSATAAGERGSAQKSTSCLCCQLSVSHASLLTHRLESRTIKLRLTGDGSGWQGPLQAMQNQTEVVTNDRQTTSASRFQEDLQGDTQRGGVASSR